MTDREIQGLLLTHYLFSAEIVKDLNYRDAWGVVNDLSVEEGICLCASIVFNVNIQERPWVVSHILTGDCFWGRTPFYAVSKKEIISRLNLRINILQNILHEQLT